MNRHTILRTLLCASLFFTSTIPMRAESRPLSTTTTAGLTAAGVLAAAGLAGMFYTDYKTKKNLKQHLYATMLLDKIAMRSPVGAQASQWWTRKGHEQLAKLRKKQLWYNFWNKVSQGALVAAGLAGVVGVTSALVDDYKQAEQDDKKREALHNQLRHDRAIDAHRCTDAQVYLQTGDARRLPELSRLIAARRKQIEDINLDLEKLPANSKDEAHKQLRDVCRELLTSDETLTQIERSTILSGGEPITASKEDFEQAITDFGLATDAERVQAVAYWQTAKEARLNVAEHLEPKEGIEVGKKFEKLRTDEKETVAKYQDVEDKAAMKRALFKRRIELAKELPSKTDSDHELIARALLGGDMVTAEAGKQLQQMLKDNADDLKEWVVDRTYKRLQKAAHLKENEIDAEREYQNKPLTLDKAHKLWKEEASGAELPTGSARKELGKGVLLFHHGFSEDLVHYLTEGSIKVATERPNAKDSSKKDGISWAEQRKMRAQKEALLKHELAIGRSLIGVSFDEAIHFGLNDMAVVNAIEQGQSSEQLRNTLIEVVEKRQQECQSYKKSIEAWSKAFNDVAEKRSKVLQTIGAIESLKKEDDREYERLKKRGKSDEANALYKKTQEWWKDGDKLAERMKEGGYGEEVFRVFKKMVKSLKEKGRKTGAEDLIKDYRKMDEEIVEKEENPLFTDNTKEFAGRNCRQIAQAFITYDRADVLDGDDKVEKAKFNTVRPRSVARINDLIEHYEWYGDLLRAERDAYAKTPEADRNAAFKADIITRRMLRAKATPQFKSMIMLGGLAHQTQEQATLAEWLNDAKVCEAVQKQMTAFVDRQAAKKAALFRKLDRILPASESMAGLKNKGDGFARRLGIPAAVYQKVENCLNGQATAEETLKLLEPYAKRTGKKYTVKQHKAIIALLKNKKNKMAVGFAELAHEFNQKYAWIAPEAGSGDCLIHDLKRWASVTSKKFLKIPAERTEITEAMRFVGRDAKTNYERTRFITMQKQIGGMLAEVVKREKQKQDELAQEQKRLNKKYVGMTTDKAGHTKAAGILNNTVARAKDNKEANMQNLNTGLVGQTLRLQSKSELRELVNWYVKQSLNAYALLAEWLSEKKFRDENGNWKETGAVITSEKWEKYLNYRLKMKMAQGLVDKALLRKNLVIEPDQAWCVDDVDASVLQEIKQATNKFFDDNYTEFLDNAIDDNADQEMITVGDDKGMTLAGKTLLEKYHADHPGLKEEIEGIYTDAEKSFGRSIITFFTQNSFKENFDRYIEGLPSCAHLAHEMCKYDQAIKAREENLGRKLTDDEMPYFDIDAAVEKQTAVERSAQSAHNKVTKAVSGIESYDLSGKSGYRSLKDDKEAREESYLGQMPELEKVINYCMTKRRLAKADGMLNTHAAFTYKLEQHIGNMIVSKLYPDDKAAATDAHKMMAALHNGVDKSWIALHLTTQDEAQRKKGEKARTFEKSAEVMKEALENPADADKAVLRQLAEWYCITTHPNYGKMEIKKNDKGTEVRQLVPVKVDDAAITQTVEKIKTSVEAYRKIEAVFNLVRKQIQAREGWRTDTIEATAHIVASPDKIEKIAEVHGFKAHKDHKPSCPANHEGAAACSCRELSFEQIIGGYDVEQDGQTVHVNGLEDVVRKYGVMAETDGQASSLEALQEWHNAELAKLHAIELPATVQQYVAEYRAMHAQLAGWIEKRLAQSDNFVVSNHELNKFKERARKINDMPTADEMVDDQKVRNTLFTYHSVANELFKEFRRENCMRFAPEAQKESN